MSFNHQIGVTPYVVEHYELDSGGIVRDWLVTVGGFEIPWDHMAGPIRTELEWQCKLDADADNKINREDHGANLALNLEAA